MLIYSILCFALLALAAYLLLSSGDAGAARKERRRERSRKKRAYQAPSKLRRRFARLLAQNDALLAETHVSRGAYLAVVLLSGAGGYLAGHIIFDAVLPAALSAVCCLAAPTAFYTYRRDKLAFERLEKLSADMMVISNSYLVTHDLIASVRTNLDVLEVTRPFSDFLAYVTYLDSDVVAGLRRMEGEVGNGYFSQWIDALVMAQRDRALVHVSIAVVSTMRDDLAAQRESDAEMSAVWADYFTVLGLIFASPLVLRLMMPAAYRLVTASPIGQGILLLLVAAVAYSVARALRINRPMSV